MQRKRCPIAASGFCYQASKFCPKLARRASDVFLGGAGGGGEFKLPKNCNQSCSSKVFSG